MISEDQDFDIELAIKRTPTEDEGQLTVDIFQTVTDIVVRSTIAGVDPNDIDVVITKDQVTIRGRRNPEEEIDPSEYYHQEIYWGPFSRSIILPVSINPDKSKASMKNGILIIRLPKLIR